MSNTAVIRVIRFASLIFGGLFAGFLLAVLVIELTLRGFDGTVYTQVRHVELVRLDDLAAITLLPALIAASTVAVVSAARRSPGSWLAVTAVLLLATVLGTTLLVNVPINTEQLSWDVQDPPADWASVRDRWQTAHAVRAGAALLAFGCLTAAALRGSSATHPG